VTDWPSDTYKTNEPRRILAMGGGGFPMPEHDHSDALDRFVLSLTGKEVPRICFLPTASGDPREQVTRFQERFSQWPCEPSILSLFHLGRDRIDPVAHVLSQDALYIGGGSMRNMLAIWREHGIEDAMRTAWERGIVLAGLSAGAMCWFEGGVSMSGGQPEVVHGIGLLPGSLTVHLNGELERLPVYEDAVATGALPAGFAADDGAAVVFHGTQLAECVVARRDARVMRIEADGSGSVIQIPQRVRVLPHAAGLPTAIGESAEEPWGVSEMRALRAGRHRWD
jgi:dipeptidase E